MKFREIDFGPDDAKGDLKLADYFVKTRAYYTVKDGRTSFVIGRKGTGKTALCEVLHQEACSDYDKFSVLLSFKNSPTNSLFESQDSNYRAPNEYISIWRFLIALEASKLVLKDESVNTETKGILSDFLQTNFSNIEVASLDAVQTLKDKSWKIGLNLPKWVPGGELSRTSKEYNYSEIHYGRAAASLLELLKEIPSKNTYYLFFDELDEDYNVDRRYFDLLISLFKAAYQVRKEFVNKIRLRPVIVLREDIFFQLDDHDINKMEEAIVRLRWQTAIRRESQFSLRLLVNERIRSNLHTRVTKDYWTEYVDEEVWGGPAQNVWNFLTIRGMDRPRDIIRSLKSCQPYEKGTKLSPESVRASCGVYSEWFSRELGSEIFKELPEYRQALGILTRIGKGDFRIDQWRREVGKVDILLKYKPDAILEILFKFGAVGMVKQGIPYFRYRSQQLTFDIGAKFIVHLGLQKYLAIRGTEPSRRRINKKTGT